MVVVAVALSLMAGCDQVFYVLKKCTERAMATCSVNAACAIVNHITSILSPYFLGERRALCLLHTRTALLWPEEGANGEGHARDERRGTGLYQDRGRLNVKYCALARAGCEYD